MSDLAALDKALNDQILTGDVLGAFEKYYADDVVMQENLDEARSGKGSNGTGWNSSAAPSAAMFPFPSGATSSASKTVPEFL